MAVPLAVVVELNEPQGEVAHVQVTPAPLLTVAVMDAVAPVVRDAGCPLRETVTVGGGGGVFELLPPPHPARVMTNAASVARRAPFRRFIAHPRSGRSCFL